MEGIPDLIKGMVSYSGLVGLGGSYIDSQFNFSTSWEVTLFAVCDSAVIYLGRGRLN
jgi:hypothetical protein